MKRLTALFLCALLIASGCRRSELIPKSEPFLISGLPSAIYDSVYPEIKKMIFEETQIMRLDSADGMIMRFSVRSTADSTVRLIEVKMNKEGDGKTRISIVSERFSLIPGSKRDSVDLAMEATVEELFKKAPN